MFTKRTETKEKSEFIVFHIVGSPEKNLIATTVVNSLHEAKPNKKIIVTTAFPEIWLHNPDVFRVYRLGNTSYFYDEYIKGKKTEVYAHDPYLTDDFIYDRKSLAEIWCEMIGIKYNGSKPKLYFTQREEEVANNLTKTDKPIFIIETNDIFPKFYDIPFDWTKDLPINIAQKIADIATQKGYQVVQIRNENQPPIIGAITLTLDFRLTLAAMKFFDKYLLIDSFLQHILASYEKTAVVSWLYKNPEINGYKIHKNISANKTEDVRKRLDKYCPLFDVKGEHLKKPVVLENVYSVDEIVKQLEL